MVPVADRDLDHLAAGDGCALADRIGDFVGAANADPDAAGAIADDDDSGEGEAASAFHDFGHARDRDDLFDHVVLRAVAATASA